MAASLSSRLLRGIGGLQSDRSGRYPKREVRSLREALCDVYFIDPHGTEASGLFFKNGMRYFSTVPNDPDTHDDFKPTNKVTGSAESLKDIVEQDVKENPVMIYMKGVPEFPQCGFSSLAVRVLQQYNVRISARNILEDPELKNAVKAFSHWPTFPQIFIKGEFIGGSDIILNMHKNGELEEKLKEIVGNQKFQ